MENARILTVCTGNICRSPLAESLLRAGLEGVPVSVSSAGTHAMDGDPASPETVDLGVQLGVSDLGVHRARYLSEQVLDGVDLVLTMTGEHSSAVLQLAPGLAKRTFTIREFAAIVASLGEDEVALAASADGADLSGRIRSLAVAVSTARGSVHLEPADADVTDPYQRGVQAYRESAEQLVPAVTTTLWALRVAAGG